MTDYIELHCHSYFSLLDGASAPETLIARAAELEMPALALTDHDAVYGAPGFARAAEEAGIHPVFGAELTTSAGHLTLLVKDMPGWKNLCWLITEARAHAPKGEALLDISQLAGHTQGLIALSGCREGAVTSAILAKTPENAERAARQFMDLFGRDGFYIEIQHHLRPDDNALAAGLVSLAERCGLNYVATNNVHYAQHRSHRLQDVLVCIRHLTTLSESAHLRRPNSEYYLKNARQISALFAAYPRAVSATRSIAEQCTFTLRYGLQDLPHHPTPAGMTSAAYLSHLCKQALVRRGLSRASDACQRLSHEIGVIERAGLANYFLVVWDIVRQADSEGIRCQGRGSAANSLVAYLLDITPINPLEHDLVFERFLSDERALPPDIDIDFDAARREELIQYIYQKYGAEHTGMACTFVTFRARSAVRDVGKVLGMPPAVIEQAAAALKGFRGEDIPGAEEVQTQLASEANPTVFHHLIDLSLQIQGLPRHLGIHNGGMVITRSPISHYLPVEPATMPGRVVVQWDKEGLEDTGLIKIDLLGLRMLSVLDEAAEIIMRHTGQSVDLDRLSFDDPAIYDLISQPDTIGVFQVESRAQSQMLPRLKPVNFNDIIIAISLIRPGPIQGNMVHPYLRRRQGEEAVTYQHPRLEPILSETLGVVLFQEQVLKVARDIAGFSPGQGEMLRRGLSHKNSYAVIDALSRAFVIGAKKQGIPADTAATVYDTLRAFGGYSLPKSHAAAFAAIVYQSAWLKRYYPAAFTAALLNNQPMGFWSPAVLVNDARHHGIAVLPVDVNRSGVRSSLEGDAIRLGLMQIKGMGDAGADRLTAARGAQDFVDLADLCHRTQLPRRLIENLILAGALDSWHIVRRQMLWQLGMINYHESRLELSSAWHDISLPALTDLEKLDTEIAVLGISLEMHPVEIYRDWLDKNHVLTSRDISHLSGGEAVKYCGLVVMHQAPPTAKGHHFITLEDEFGIMDIVVRPKIYEQFQQIWREARIMVVSGHVQKQNGAVNIIARYTIALT